MKGTISWMLAVLAVGAGALAVQQLAGAKQATVEWRTGTPEQVGLSAARLDALRAALAGRRTAALLVARQGRLVYEWYGDDHSRNELRNTAALAKAVVGTMALLGLVEDQVVGLDDRAATYITAWEADSARARITLRQLASHNAGLDDVHFPPRAEAATWFAGKPVWKRRYFEHPEERFELALTTVPLVYEPGAAYRYSGTGYYALSYALSAALRAHSREDLRNWLARHVYEPLGIPADAWRLSYGSAYEADGLTLYAIGSGAAFTPRALARIGQHVLDRLRDPVFHPLRPLEPSEVARRPGLLKDVVGIAGRAVPRLGWWGNDARAWPSLPVDALVAVGANEQVLLVIPSRDLVVVRTGGPLSGTQQPVDEEALLEEALFAPLVRAIGMEAVPGPGL